MHCGANTCSAATCLGCCDASGRCAPGTVTTSCGAAGRQCVPCPTDAQCREGVCTVVIGAGGGSATSGGGTAATGGGSATTGGGTATTGGGTASTGGGSSSGCLQLPQITASPARGLYIPRNNNTEMVWTMGATITLAQPVGGTTFVNVQADLYHPMGSPPTFPVRGTISPTTTNRTCNQCFRLETGCNMSGSGCTGSYIARAGSYSYLSGDTNMQMGRYTGEALTLQFVGWNYQSDSPRSDLQCVELPQLAWNADWP